MKLIRTTILSGISTFLRLISSFIINKFIAVIAGPIGITTIAQFTNLTTITVALGTFSSMNGVITNISSNKDDKNALKLFLNTIFSVVFISTLIVAILILFFYNSLSFFLFKSVEYRWYLIVFAFTLIFNTTFTVILSIINGLHQVKYLTIINIMGSVLLLLLPLLSGYLFGINGIIIGLIIAPFFNFFIAFHFFRKSLPWFKLKEWRIGFGKQSIASISSFSLMAFVSAICFPVTQMIIREIIVRKFGTEPAGFWQAIIRISDGYLLFITTTLSVYYLPKLASLKSDIELKSEIIKCYKAILPIIFIITLTVYFLRSYVTRILYTNDFAFVNELYLWQLLGDVIKIAAWLLGYLLIVQVKTRAFIVIEVAFSLSYILLVYLFTHTYHSLVSVTQAFALNSFALLICLVSYYFNFFFKKEYAT